MGFLSGAMAKLRGGLTRTRDAFTGGIRSLLVGRVLTEEVIRELEVKLIQGDVGVATTGKLIERVREGYIAGRLKRGEEVLDLLRTELKALWPAADRSLRFAPPGEGPTVILVTGVNGAGKTTSIAKLCSMLRREGRSVLVGACDTFRAGAVRQLEIWAERVGVEIVRGQEGGDPAAVAFDACAAARARAVDVVILDTAGRLHTQDPLMRQLEKLHKVIGKQVPGGPHEVLLVLDATSGQNALRQAEEFAKAARVTGIFLAKLDGTARGGIVIAIREKLGIPVKFVGIGETPEDVQPFDPDSFVDALFAVE
ncbi:MAG TPA: signal recognition particle-docking protein FtsY [Phycisphaerales bacterium]|nr:signal recognition particle-docking protein FtsY [Phycisphaerales bacterium]